MDRDSIAGQSPSRGPVARPAGTGAPAARGLNAPVAYIRLLVSQALVTLMILKSPYGYGIAYGCNGKFGGGTAWCVVLLMQSFSRIYMLPELEYASEKHRVIAG